MEYINAKSENIEEIYQLVRDTVKTVYPKYYPQEVVDFFCQWHSKENIRKDIESGLVGMLVLNFKGMVMAVSLCKCWKIKLQHLIRMLI